MAFTTWDPQRGRDCPLGCSNNSPENGTKIEHDRPMVAALRPSVSPNLILNEMGNKQFILLGLRLRPKYKKIPFPVDLTRLPVLEKKFQC